MLRQNKTRPGCEGIKQDEGVDCGQGLTDGDRDNSRADQGTTEV